MQVAINVQDKIKLCIDGALPLLKGICDKIGLSELIDEKLGNQDNRIVSTGKAIMAIVLNTIVQRRPLYKLERFYEKTDTEKLFGEGVDAGQLNDDVMARALDELYEIGPKKIMTEAAMGIINKFNIKVEGIHADTTSKSVYGEYAECEDNDDLLQVTNGYSKDNRPDLKQILFGLGVTKEKIIVVGEVSDGNTSDKEWNKDILKELRNVMKSNGLADFIYVADSAAVTEDMLKSLAGNGNDELEIPFVTRLPGNYSLESELRSKAHENTKGWEEAGSFSDRENSCKYRVQSFQNELYGKQYRFVVCSSDELDKRKEKKLSKQMEKELEKVKPIVKKLNRREFYCEKDALEEIKQVEKSLGLSYHELTFKVHEEEKVLKRSSRGKPCKDEDIQTETIYRLKVEVYEDDLKIKEYRDKEGMFVLISNVLKEQMDDREILREYKEQVSVEACFRILKDPYFIDELFVKIPERLEALAYVMIISLMVLNLLERNVRASLKEDGGHIRIVGKIKTDRPTGNAIVEALDHVSVVLVYRPETQDWQRICNIDANTHRILKLAGFDDDIYSHVNIAG